MKKVIIICAAVIFALAVPAGAVTINYTVSGWGPNQYPASITPPADAPWGVNGYPGDTLELVTYTGTLDLTPGTYNLKINTLKWSIDYTYGGTETEWDYPDHWSDLSFNINAARGMSIGTAAGSLSQAGLLECTWDNDYLALNEGVTSSFTVQGYRVDVTPLGLGRVAGNCSGSNPWVQPERDVIARFDVVPEPPPTEVWVDDDYCEVCSNDGHTWGYDAFAVIQQGINAVADSGTVNVAPGDYNESLLVNKSNLSFIGANAGIPGSLPRSDEANIIGYVKVMSNGISFNGFKFTDGAQVPAGEKAGIYIVGGTSGHTIQCNMFTRTGAAPGGPDAFRAIINEFGGVSSLQVKQNKFTGWHTGVYLQNADAQVTNNVMVENYVGMSIDGAVSVTVAYNSFIDNGLEGLGVGIPPLTSLTLEHNCFSGNLTAVANWQSIEINAEHNSWGDSTGPYNSISNPDGQGDAVSDNVDFDPWLPACCGDPLHLPPVGDLNQDCRVNFLDFAVFANAWLSSQGDDNWNQACNFEPKDNVIDTLDLRILADHWLECTME